MAYRPHDYVRPLDVRQIENRSAHIKRASYLELLRQAFQDRLFRRSDVVPARRMQLWLPPEACLDPLGVFALRPIFRWRPDASHMLQIPIQLRPRRTEIEGLSNLFRHCPLIQVIAKPLHPLDKETLHVATIRGSRSISSSESTEGR